MAADQDWRLKADLGPAANAGVLDELIGSLHRGGPAAQLANQVATTLPNDVVITHDGGTLFAYALTQGEIRSARDAVHALAPQVESVISHWEEGLDDWVQVDPPLAGAARRLEDALEHDAERIETRTMVTSAGRQVRAEIEQSMRESAEDLGLQLTINEHRHLLTCQVLFAVTGPKRKIDEFAQGLNAEEKATMRAERAVMMSPL